MHPAREVILVVFDNGGTLIDDPFPKAIVDLCNTSPLGRMREVVPEMDEHVMKKICAFWAEENSNYDFPLASHFLQEEIWIRRALSRLAEKDSTIGPGTVPYIVPELLIAYRLAARNVIARQPQLPVIRQCLQKLHYSNIILAVASNDREFATSAMLQWAGLLEYFDYVATSEGLSTSSAVVQKPSPQFFRLFEENISQLFNVVISKKIHIGDNEGNDVEAPRCVGYKTIRYINRENPQEMKWLDHRLGTRADYKYTDPAELHELLKRVIGSN